MLDKYSMQTPRINTTYWTEWGGRRVGFEHLFNIDLPNGCPVVCSFIRHGQSMC